MPHRSPAASTSTKALRPPQPSLKSRRGRKPAPDPERHLRDVPLLPARGSRRRTTGCGTRHRPTVASLSRRKTRWAASALSRPTAPDRYRACATARRLEPACQDCSRLVQDRAAAPHCGVGVPPESHLPTACAFESPPQKQEMARARRAVILLVTPLVAPLVNPLVTPLLNRRFHGRFRRGSGGTARPNPPGSVRPVRPGALDTSNV